jgi:ferredoxin
MTIKINVDMAKCQHYGQCVFEAPEIFRLNSDDKLEYTAEADDRHLPNAGNLHRRISASAGLG